MRYFLAFLLVVSFASPSAANTIIRRAAAGGGTPLDVASVLLNASAERLTANCFSIDNDCATAVVSYDQAWTIEMMVNCAATGGPWRGAFMIDTDSANNLGGLYLDVDDSQVAWHWGPGSLWTDMDAEGDVCDGTWHRLSFSHAASTTTVTTYLDGSLVGTSTNATDTGTPTGGTFVLGPSYTASGDIPTAYFSDVRVWSEARSSGNISTHWDCQIECADGVTSCPANLAFYWPINENDATTTAAEMVGGATSVAMTLSNSNLWEGTIIPTFDNDGGGDCYLD